MPIYRGREVTGFAQDDAGVDVALVRRRDRCAREYLVGCDGGRSLVRKAAGIEFPGWDPTTSNLIAEVEMAEEPESGIRRDALGIHALGRLEYEIGDGEIVYADRGPIGVMVTERAWATGEPTLRDLSDGAHRRLRDRLRRPQPDLDLALHRHDAAGGDLPRGARAAGRRRRARASARSAARASTSACRTR